MAQHIDVSDRLTTISEHHRHIGQHPTPIMNRGERAPSQRLRHLTSQIPAIGQHAQTNTPA
jgi:hypothetical protein